MKTYCLWQRVQRNGRLCRHLSYGEIQGIDPIIAGHLGPITTHNLIEASRLHHSNEIIGRVLGEASSNGVSSIFTADDL